MKTPLNRHFKCFSKPAQLSWGILFILDEMVVIRRTKSVCRRKSMVTAVTVVSQDCSRQPAWTVGGDRVCFHHDKCRSSICSANSLQAVTNGDRAHGAGCPTSDFLSLSASRVVVIATAFVRGAAIFCSEPIQAWPQIPVDLSRHSTTAAPFAISLLSLSPPPIF